MRIKLQKYFEGIDWVFLTLVMVIIFFGLIMLTSASAPVGYDKFYDSYHYIKHQLIFGFIPGLIGMFIFLQVPYERLRRYAFPLLVVSVVLLIMVFIPGLGSEYGTAKSWIVIGGFSLQPSEIVKLTFLFYLAAWLEARGREGVSDFSKGLVPFLSVLGVIMLLIVLQPDIGTMSIIVATSLVVYFIAGAPLLYLSGIGAAGIGFLFMLISFAPYRAARFMTFLHPELDPQGIGYHINQALLAIGSGGLFGLGYGHSRQKFQYLPEVSGDSIFAVVAEELGFFLAVAVVILFVYLLDHQHHL